MNRTTKSSSADVLAPYMREMGQINRMTPETEREAAIEIGQLRVALWRQILAYPPFVEAVARLAESAVDIENELARSLAAFVVDARRLRDRTTKANRKAFEVSGEKVAAELGEADRDGILSAQVLEDLQAMARGESASHLDVRNPPRGSRPYAEFVTRCQHAAHKLGRARAKFVEANLRLVVSLVHKMGRGQLPLHDLIQEGNLGLMKAVDRFDPDRGVRFSTYAAWWIRHAVSRAIADKSRAVRLPVHMVEQRNKLRRLTRSFEAEKGRTPNDRELAETAQIKLGKLRKSRCFLIAQGVSLDTPIGERGRDCYGDLLADDTEGTEDKLVAQELLSELQVSMSQLSPVEAEVLRLRMGMSGEEGLTLREIGERFSLSRERIRQIQEKALRQLREHFRSADLM